MEGNSEETVPPAKLQGHQLSDQAVGPNPKCGAAMHVALEAPSSLAIRSQWHLSGTNAPAWRDCSCMLSPNLCLWAGGTHGKSNCPILSIQNFVQIAQQQAFHDLGMKIIKPKMRALQVAPRTPKYLAIQNGEHDCLHHSSFFLINLFGQIKII